jgi:hypothetical protein
MKLEFKITNQSNEAKLFNLLAVNFSNEVKNSKSFKLVENILHKGVEECMNPESINIELKENELAKNFSEFLEKIRHELRIKCSNFEIESETTFNVNYYFTVYVTSEENDMSFSSPVEFSSETNSCSVKYPIAFSKCETIYSKIAPNSEIKLTFEVEEKI